MKYYSTNGNAAHATLHEAVVKGLASDKGLFMPQVIKPLPQSFYDEIENLSFQEIAYRVADAFFGEDVPPPDDGAVNSEIENMTEEERSKAALMLLVAQTYFSQNNKSSVGMGTANAALNSVLNRQMDQILGSKLKNTDVDLGIDTYNTQSGAARTDYSIKVSQRFLNDRFRATFGGSVSSGGDTSSGSGARLGDMSLEWLIKKDGSHYLKLYRRYNYESVLEGEVIESGIGYAQERTAYRFKHLLIPTSKSRQARILSAIRELQQAEEQAEAKASQDKEDENDEM